MDRLARLTELRRALPLVAAALLLVALALPMWRITLTAPQYPGRALPVELYAYPRLGGEYAEVQLLNSYVGFYYPDPVFVEPNYEVHENAIAAPEWVLGPIAFAAVAATGVFVAFAPTVRKLKLGLTCQLLGTVAVFGGMGVLIQYRLYQAGHSLDPNAPLRGVDGFTPPLLGSYEVANISGHAWIGPGGYLTAAAIALLVVAFLLRDSEAVVGDVPDLLRSSLGRIRGRLRRRREDDSSDRPDGTPGAGDRLRTAEAVGGARAITAPTERNRSRTRPASERDPS